MHIFVYEWATGGGLIEAQGTLPASLVREGTAMISALAGDLARVEGSRVTVLRDPRVLQLSLPRCEIVEVVSAAALHDEFERLTAEADRTMVIAPEFDGILWKTARHVVACGGTLLSPSPEFVRIAGDKQQTCERLAAANVPVPEGLRLEPDEPLPAGVAYPAVIKPVDGAGSQDTYLLSGPHDAPASAWPRRLERFIPGMAASVAVLCGPAGRVSLPPTKQRISNDGRLRYLGGEIPIAPGLAYRATTLALRALGAMPAATGYVGVDLVLGRDPNGTEDVVIEINPRLTTSYIGLRALAADNLSDAMCRVAQGEPVQINFDSRPLEFDTDGNASFLT